MDKWVKANLPMVLEELVTGLVEEVVVPIGQEEVGQVSATQVGDGQMASYTSNGESLFFINYSYTWKFLDL